MFRGQKLSFYLFEGDGKCQTGKKCLKVMKHFFFTFGLIDKLVRGTARTKTATTCFNLQRVSSDKTRLPREVFTG